MQAELTSSIVTLCIQGVLCMTVVGHREPLVLSDMRINFYEISFISNIQYLLWIGSKPLIQHQIVRFEYSLTKFKSLTTLPKGNRNSLPLIKVFQGRTGLFFELSEYNTLYTFLAIWRWIWNPHEELVQKDLLLCLVPL